MMRGIPIIVLAVWVLMGCTTHSQHIKGDQVYLNLRGPGIQSVFFASSLDGFQHHPLTRHTDKTWSIHLPAEHEFTYFYIMDGQAYLPDCQYKEKDDFGSENCIFIPEL
jgi:hypothetical protein